MNKRKTAHKRDIHVRKSTDNETTSCVAKKGTDHDRLKSNNKRLRWMTLMRVESCMQISWQWVPHCQTGSVKNLTGRTVGQAPL